MGTRARFGVMALSAVTAVLAACSSTPDAPPATSTSGPSSPAATSPSTPASTPASSTPATPAPPTMPASFPLAVVTGQKNLKANISVTEVTGLARAGDLLVPCGVSVTAPALTTSTPCTAPDRIAAAVIAKPQRIALLPPGLVEPATKVLSISGKGPFGMFGPDLFGDKAARALPYPIQATAEAGGPLKAEWAAYRPESVWTMTNVGSLCSDRGGAYQAHRYGKGWKYVFNGGTARYASKPPVDPPNAEPYNPVRPIDTGRDGSVARLLRQSDIAIADHECPLVSSGSYEPQYGTVAVFSVPETVLPIWRDLLGLDVIYLAANHMSDKGEPGIRSTLKLLDKHKLARTGLGRTLDEALEPAYATGAGLRIGFVAFNDVAGVVAADKDTAGVAWITKANIREGVRRAKLRGADLVVCNPQWWGGAEYHDDLWPIQKKQLAWFEQGGCDHVIGSGTHVAGPLLLKSRGASGVSATLASPGNFAFGQGWWQETQEGVILDLSFSGTRLVNVRLRPTVMILQARPALLDPEGDGRYVLQRVHKYSTLDYD